MTFEEKVVQFEELQKRYDQFREHMQALRESVSHLQLEILKMEQAMAEQAKEDAGEAAAYFQRAMARSEAMAEALEPKVAKAKTLLTQLGAPEVAGS